MRAFFIGKMKKIKNRETLLQISAYLESFLTDNRKDRLIQVLNERTRHVTVVVEDLFQTQNISAVMRSCDCLGVQDIHIVEAENPFSVHTAITMGADKWLTHYHYPAVDGKSDIANCIRQLKKKGYSVVATLPDEDSCYLEELPIEQPIALLFGTELTGLSPEAIQLADQTVKIPMYGFTTSFNISNSVAIILSFLAEKLRKSTINWRLSEEEKEELYFEWLQKSVKTPKLLIQKFLTENGLQL